MKYFFLFLFTISLQIANAADKCENLFSHFPVVHSVQGEFHLSARQKYLIDEWVAPFEKALLADNEELNRGEKSKEVVKLLHLSILQLIDNAEVASLSEPILDRISKIDTDPFFRGFNFKAAIVNELSSLLKLVHADITDWKKFLFDYASAVEKSGSSGNELISPHATLGYMIQNLPSEKKIELVQYLGTLYTGPLKRIVSKFIHAALDPKSLYLKYKNEGRSDKQFFEKYLEILNSTAFKGQNVVGGYNAQPVIELALAMQSYLKDRPDLQALNFFGSVPNGFATHASDLDVFNHPDPKAYPELAQQAAEAWGNWRVADPFEAKRYQIEDSLMVSKVSPILAKYKLRWHLKDTGDKAHEHFGSMTQIFSFHITAQKIVLRFYANYMSFDRSGNRTEPWEFIELDVTK